LILPPGNHLYIYPELFWELKDFTEVRRQRSPW
jgi:hypothetical protein